MSQKGDEQGRGDESAVRGCPGASGGLAGQLGRGRVLVTGHTGFKGSWLCQWLIGAGVRPIGLSLEPPSEPSLFEMLGLGGSMEDHRVDVRDREGVRRVVHGSGAEVIIHMAAQALVRPSYADPHGTYETNVMGTANVLEAVRTRPREVPRVAVVVVTSDKCYRPSEVPHTHDEDDPLGGNDPYSASKAAAEIVTSSYRSSFFPPSRLAEHGVALASARAGNVIGGGDWARDRLVPDIAGAMHRGEAVVLRNPGSDRPWQHVLDALSGYVWLASRLLCEGGVGHEEGVAVAARASRAWNFGPDESDPLGRLTVRDLTTRMVRSWRGDRVGHAPLDGAVIERPDPAAPRESVHLGLSISRAKAELGWRPTWSAAEAVHRTAEWYRDVLSGMRDARAATLEQLDAYKADAARRGAVWACGGSTSGRAE